MQLSAAHIAVKEEGMETLQFLDSLPKVSWDLVNCNHYTPFLYAIYYGFEQKARFLVEKGVDLETKTKKSFYTPIYIAASIGTIEKFRLLISLGCDIN